VKILDPSANHPISSRHGDQEIVRGISYFKFIFKSVAPQQVQDLKIIVFLLVEFQFLVSLKYAVIIELNSPMGWILAPYFKIQFHFEKKIIETG
jgi:hypothetical protein